MILLKFYDTFVIVRYCVQRHGAGKHSFHRLFIFADRSDQLTRSVIENLEVKVVYANSAR